MFVLNPDPYLLPTYRISPFRTEDIYLNNHYPDSNLIDDYFSRRFRGRNYCYTTSGKSAIHLTLSHYQLKPDDVVTIFTTTNNFYISSCITKEIEHFCKWSRKMEAATRLIFLNHEFGYPVPNTSDYLKYGLPIIEDCCHSFFSTNQDNTIGKTGNFVIYSFPKMFPIQIGGLLLSREGVIKKDIGLDTSALRYIRNSLSLHIQGEKEIIDKRRRNYSYLKEHFGQGFCTPRFEFDDSTVPGVYMFKVNNNKNVLPKLKEFFYAHGVQCSVFYGEDAFFIPVHQSLETDDLDYFICIMDAFLKHEMHEV